MDKRLLDKDWRLKNLYQIKNKEQEKVIFTPNKAQRHFHKNKHSRNIILKSRQLGFTTFETIDMLDESLFTRNFSGIMISHEQKISVDIFKNKFYYAWENFPDPLKELYSMDAERANQLIFDFGDGTFSTIQVGASGRSGTYNRIHVTELGKMAKKYPERAREVLEGTIPAVPMNGRVDIESTAEGNYGMFHDMFWEAYNRERDPHPTEYKAFFYNWTWEEREISQVRTLIPVREMDEWKTFADYQKKHKLTDQQITYYYLKWLSLKKNWEALHQEYPTTPEEAFVGSGHQLFDPEKISRQLKVAKGGKVDGDWIFYDDYVDGGVYALGADVAEGVGQDSSTIVIMDLTGLTPRVVAEFASNKIPPDVFAYEIKRGAMKYGGALVAVERNNHGHTTIATLKGIYDNLYTEIKEDRITNVMTEKLGWLTTSASKPKMIYELSEAINQGSIEIPSKRILEELRTYDKEDVTVARFDKNQTRHWDLVIALAICYQMRAFAFEEDMEIITQSQEQF